MASHVRQSKRSFTGNHALLPAIKPIIPNADIIQKPAYGLLAWTLGAGSVIWKIWPSVAVHTLFAAGIVALYETRGFRTLAIPNVMLTVLGVVIGFVISYRAVSGYERYWMGRTTWSDVIRNARTAGRLIWFHVPPRLTPKAPNEAENGRPTEELIKVMAEKRMALDLVEGFAVALKHHIRGEVGIYYEDLYDLVRPLHEHDHTPEQKAAAAATSALPPPSRAHRIASNPSLPKATGTSSSSNAAYGTFNGEASSSDLRRVPSAASEHQPLKPAQQPTEENVMDKVSPDLIPFAGMFASIKNIFSRRKGVILGEDKSPYAAGASSRKWGGPLHPRVGDGKHRAMANNTGENLPLEILRCLSEWYSVLEERGTVPGTSLGGLIGTIAAMEETLSTLEKILTTPLPFVYSVHIRHTVWIYLFFLPFQLVKDFHWYVVPGVSIASFIYLGFLAAGEEIEQPFGYDENDLDLDMFCQEIIHLDIAHLKTSPCLNAYLPPQQHNLIRHRSMTLTEVTAYEDSSDTD